MGTQILLIFRAHLLLHQRHIVLEGHRLSMQSGLRHDVISLLSCAEKHRENFHLSRQRISEGKLIWKTTSCSCSGSWAQKCATLAPNYQSQLWGHRVYGRDCFPERPFSPDILDFARMS